MDKGMKKQVRKAQPTAKQSKKNGTMPVQKGQISYVRRKDAMKKVKIA